MIILNSTVEKEKKKSILLMTITTTAVFFGVISSPLNGKMTQFTSQEMEKLRKLHSGLFLPRKSKTEMFQNSERNIANLSNIITQKKMKFQILI
ncbi:hypothetical protein MQX03_14350 [Chryseobacterium aahli]|nr:hypothetical protein [Chryseobacterium aahli]